MSEVITLVIPARNISGQILRHQVATMLWFVIFLSNNLQMIDESILS